MRFRTVLLPLLCAFILDSAGRNSGASALPASLTVAIPPNVGTDESKEASFGLSDPRARTVRVNETSRGGEEGELIIRLLAPADHVGETINKSPVLSWFLSQKTSRPLIFTLEDSRHLKPVLEVPLKPPACPGIQMIGLADHGIELEELVQYRWHISMIVDPEARSKDIHAMAFIERIHAVENSIPPRDPSTYPYDGQPDRWYDVVQIVSDLIVAHPKDRVLRLIRASLLDQVGLDDVANYDRTQNETLCPPR